MPFCFQRLSTGLRKCFINSDHSELKSMSNNGDFGTIGKDTKEDE